MLIVPFLIDGKSPMLAGVCEFFVRCKRGYRDKQPLTLTFSPMSSFYIICMSLNCQWKPLNKQTPQRTFLLWGDRANHCPLIHDLYLQFSRNFPKYSMRLFILGHPHQKNGSIGRLCTQLIMTQSCSVKSDKAYCPVLLHMEELGWIDGSSKNSTSTQETVGLIPHETKSHIVSFKVLNHLNN